MTSCSIAADMAAGDDTLVGGAGVDSLDGGTGTDTADYNASGAAVTVNLTTGTGSGGDAQGDTLVNIEKLTGSAFADVLTGDGNANTLAGGAGADSLFGGAGNDVLIGGDTTSLAELVQSLNPPAYWEFNRQAGIKSPTTCKAFLPVKSTNLPFLTRPCLWARYNNFTLPERNTAATSSRVAQAPMFWMAPRAPTPRRTAARVLA